MSIRTSIRAWGAWLAWLAAWLLIGGGVAHADDTHYRNVLIGDRALGMGGAFTAVADDPAAAYYNPAGLSLVGNSSVSASLQVNSLEMRTIEGAYTGVGGQRADFEHEADPSVPVFVSLLKKFGPKDADGQRRHAFGLSTFHPSRRTLRYSVALDALDPLDGNIRVFEDYRVRREDSTSWFGPSYSFAARNDLAFGISAFLSTRTFRHEEELSQVNASANASNTADTDQFVSQSTTVEMNARHLVLRLGVLYAPSESIQLGLMFQPPGVALAQDARVTARSLSAFPGELPQFARSTQKLSAASPIPWELRAGVAWLQPVMDLKIALDLSLHGPSGSPDAPVVAVGSPRADRMFSDYVPWMGDFLADQHSRVLTVNAALGVEMTIADVLPVRAGVFTNRSSARNIPAVTNQYRPDDVHQYGMSLSVGLRTGGYDLSIGGAAMLGSGSGLRKLGGAEAADLGASYARTDVRDTTMVFFITGYRQAISRAARVAYNEFSE